jgi:hypothetical protein
MSPPAIGTEPTATSARRRTTTSSPGWSVSSARTGSPPASRYQTPSTSSRRCPAIRGIHRSARRAPSEAQPLAAAGQVVRPSGARRAGPLAVHASHQSASSSSCCPSHSKRGSSVSLSIAVSTASSRLRDERHLPAVGEPAQLRRLGPTIATVGVLDPCGWLLGRCGLDRAQRGAHAGGVGE